MYQLVREDTLTPYIPGWANGLPDIYKEKDGYFHSFWQTPIVIAYNTDYITKEQAPKEWTDLVKEDYQEKYAIGNSGGQTTRTYLAGFLWNYFDEAKGEITQEGWDMLTKFYSNAGTMPANDADIWKAFKDGSMPILPWWYGGVKSNCEKNQIPVDYVVPANGTPVVAEAVGIVKGTKKEEAAKKFIDWFGDPKTMASYANEFNQAPAHPDAIALCDDKVKKDASMFAAQTINWGIVSEQMDSWLEKIELEIMQ